MIKISGNGVSVQTRKGLYYLSLAEYETVKKYAEMRSIIISEAVIAMAKKEGL